MKRIRAFTLIEIMIVVAIIAFLAILAVPSFLNARRSAQATAFLDDLRVYSDAAEMYHFDNGEYPEDSSTGDLPTGFELYIKSDRWLRKPPVGGEWDFERDSYGVASAVGIHFRGTANVPHEVIEIVDTRADNGDIKTGAFRLLQPDRYYCIIAE